MPGTYRGTIEYSGEGDVPTASFTRTVLLEALNFASLRTPARSFGFLLAGACERDGGVRIARSTLEFFGPESFAVSERGRKPETVRVKLPEPYGSGSHSQSLADARLSWSR